MPVFDKYLDLTLNLLLRIIFIHLDTMAHFIFGFGLFSSVVFENCEKP